MYMWQRHVWYLYEKLCSWDIFRLLRPKSSVQFMGTLWRYNLKTKNGCFSASNCHFFTQNQMLCLYWKFSAIGLLSFHFLTPTSSEQFKVTLWPQNWNKTRFFPCNCVISSQRFRCYTSIKVTTQLVKSSYCILMKWLILPIVILK